MAMIQYVCKLHWVACTSHRLTNSELLALRPLESILWGRQPPTTLGNLTDPWSGVHHLFVERDVNVSFSGSGTLQSLKQSKAVSDPMDVSSPIGMAGGLPFRAAQRNWAPTVANWGFDDRTARVGEIRREGGRRVGRGGARQDPGRA